MIWAVLHPESAQGFVLLKSGGRWSARTFGWFSHYRCLSKDYEVLPETSEAFIHLAMIRIMVRRLASVDTSNTFLNTLSRCRKAIRLFQADSTDKAAYPKPG
ncbi:transposase [filamentous cyanobacterium LEGE 07170]|nr:transposase [filamentous cyanobacterium LEGE 07170]